MEQFILIFAMLLCVTGICAQEVTEETRDAAYSAPTTKITSHKWVCEKDGAIYTFLPNGTYSWSWDDPEAETAGFTLRCKCNGTWARQNKEYLIIKTNSKTVTYTVINKTLSERKLAEVKASAAQVQQKERTKGIERKKYTIGKLNNDTMLLIPNVMWEGKEQEYSDEDQYLVKLKRYQPTATTK